MYTKTFNGVTWKNVNVQNFAILISGLFTNLAEQATKLDHIGLIVHHWGSWTSAPRPSLIAVLAYDLIWFAKIPTWQTSINMNAKLLGCFTTIWHQKSTFFAWGWALIALVQDLCLDLNSFLQLWSSSDDPRCACVQINGTMLLIVYEDHKMHDCENNDDSTSRDWLWKKNCENKKNVLVFIFIIYVYLWKT